MKKLTLNLYEALNNSNAVATNIEADDWKSAIKKTIGKLIAIEACDKIWRDEFILEVKDNLEDCVIADHVALLSSKNVAHTYKNAITLITLKKPVDFGTKKVSILLSFVSPDKELNDITFFKQIAKVFKQQGYLNAFLSFNDEIQVLNYIRNIILKNAKH